MKKELLRKLVNDDKERFQTFYIDIGDDSFNRLSLGEIMSLLEIKSKKARFEALETITHPLIIDTNPNFIGFIINTFKRVESPIIADYLNFIVVSEDLLASGKLKYFTLIDTVSKLKDEDKVCYISNIFWNKLIYSFSTEDYINTLNYCLSLNNTELEELVIEVCEKKKLNKLTLKK